MVTLQAFNFALLARFLGVMEYGTIATINALASMLGSMVGLGFGSVMLMQVARDTTQAPAAAGNALLVQFATGLFAGLTGAILVVLISASPIPITLALCVLVAELVFMRTAITAAQLLVACDKHGAASAVNVGASAIRVASISLVILFFDSPTAYEWAWVFLVLSFFFCIFLVWLVAEAAGALRVDWRSIVGNLGRGSEFSMGTLAKAIYTDADKIILARFASAADVGLYAAAYRIAAISFMPVRSLLEASAARIFKAGEAGIGSTLKLSAALLRFALPYSFLVCVLIFGAASFLPVVFGSEFTGSVPLLKILAILPILQTLHYTFADALSGSGNQRLRMYAQFSVVIIYLALALSLIPAFGPEGAVATSIASESALVLLIAAAILWVRQREAPRQ